MILSVFASVTNDPISFSCASHLVKARMLGQISGKKHSCLNAALLHVLNNFISVYAFLAGDQETKPARVVHFHMPYRKDQLV